MAMEQLEIELKFHLADPRPIQERLPTLGAECIGQKVFEHNVRYDTESDRLNKQRCLLRMRRDRATTLTFKSPPSTAADSRFKIYREVEVRLDDFEAMDAILEALLSCLRLAASVPGADAGSRLPILGRDRDALAQSASSPARHPTNPRVERSELGLRPRQIPFCGSPP